MKLKLVKGKTIFKIGKVEFDKQDISISILMAVVVVIIASFIDLIGLNGVHATTIGLLISTTVLHRVLVAKGKIKKQ